MFSPTIRAWLVVLLGGTGVFLASHGRVSGWLLIASAIGFTYGYFRYGAVWAAWRALKSERPGRAKHLISTVRYPNLLAPQHQAYYYFTRGVLSMQEARLEAAEGFLLKAVEGVLRITNDLSIALLTLAEIKARRGEAHAAQEFLERAQATPHRQELEQVFEQVALVVDDAS